MGRDHQELRARTSFWHEDQETRAMFVALAEIRVGSNGDDGDDRKVRTGR